MGFTFTVTQALLIRELLVAFFGNELTIGIILACWLLLEATGSGLLGRLAGRWGNRAPSFAALQVLFALFLPICFFAAHISRALAGAIPGEGVGLIPIFVSSFLILLPLALVDGAMFTFGVRAYSRLTAQRAPSVGRVYVYEAVGGIVGGVVFTYLFLPLLFSLQIVLVISGLNLLAAAWIMVAAGRETGARWLRSPRLGLVVSLLAVAVAVLVSPLAGGAQRWMSQQQWAGQDLVYSENSVYGNVAVVHRAGQYTFYADGIPILTAPTPDVALVEDVVHLPMLFLADPHHALVLSGGVGGVLHELGKYPLTRIDYAELDPLLIAAVERFPTPLTRSELADPRVHVEYTDGRLLVREKALAGDRSAEPYDLVIVNLPYPSSLQLNRFYTVEFFQMVERLLGDDGILVLTSPASLTYMSDELRNLNAMIQRSLEQAFTAVRPIPGHLTLWLASPSQDLADATPDTLLARWAGHEIETQMVTGPYLRHRLDPSYLEWFRAALGEGDGDGDGPFINRDLHPIGLFYGLAYWNALFSPAIADLLGLTGRLNLWTVGLPVFAAMVLLAGVMKLTSRGRGAVVPLVIVTTGITGMTADIMMIFAFQTLYGYVFQWIGLLITSFMGGLSLGGLLMTVRLARITRAKAALVKLDLALVLFWALLPGMLGALYAGITAPLANVSIPGALLLANAVAGFLVGAQFPLANKLWLASGESRGGGALYAADLVGAFLGAVLVSVLLMPVLGIPATCLLAALLKLGSLLLLATLPRGAPNGP
jgi:spermidine synthase